MSGIRGQTVQGRHGPLIRGHRHNICNRSIHIHLVIGNRQAQQRRPTDHQPRLKNIADNHKRRPDIRRGHRLQHRRHIGEALRRQIKIQRCHRCQRGPDREETADTVGSDHALKLLVGGGGIHPEFLAHRHAIVMQKLGENPFTRTILPQTGPGNQIVEGNRTDAGIILITRHVSVHHADAAAGGIGKRPGIDIPAILLNHLIQSPPDKHKAAILSRSHRRVGADRIGRIDKKFRTRGRAAGIKQPGINVHARNRRRRLAGINTISTQRCRHHPLLLGNPARHKPAVRQRRHRRRALIVIGKLVHQKFGPDFCSRRAEDLPVHILQGIGARLVVAGPEHHRVAIRQHRHHRIDLEVVRKRIDKNVIRGSEGIGGGEKARVNVLVTFLAPLPDKNRPAIF